MPMTYSDSMLRADGRNTLKKKRGTTTDIVDEVIDTYSDTWRTTAELAEKLKGVDELETCQNVFDFVVSSVKYKEDPPGIQHIKTPARLLHDGIGDCKSMAILTASILANLNIPCSFRFVSFSPNKQITHVYVVTDSGLILDPVERVNGQPKFNYASDYTYKKDMNTTIISRLSGVGAVEDIYAPYMADTCFIDNTIAENYLFSELDYTAALCRAFPNQIEHLNTLDRIVVAYNLYQRSRGYDTLMMRAGAVIQTLEDEHYFTFNSTDDNLRGQNLNELINSAIDLLIGGKEVNYNGVYVEWWHNQIETKDYNSLTAEQKNNYRNSIGIGASQKEINALLAQMQESAPYFLYLYLGRDWALKNRQKFPKVFKKYLIEEKVFNNWVRGVKGVLDSQTIYNNLKSGFLKRTNQTPEQFINKVLSANGYKIGLAPAVIAAIIAGVVSIVGMIIDAVARISTESMADVSNFPTGLPDDYDFTMSTLTDTPYTDNTTDNGGLLLLAGLAAVLLLSNKK